MQYIQVSRMDGELTDLKTRSRDGTRRRGVEALQQKTTGKVIPFKVVSWCGVCVFEELFPVFKMPYVVNTRM